MEGAGADDQALAFSLHGIVRDLPLDQRVGGITQLGIRRAIDQRSAKNNSAPMAMSTMTNKDVGSFIGHCSDHHRGISNLGITDHTMEVLISR